MRELTRITIVRIIRRARSRATCAVATAASRGLASIARAARDLHLDPVRSFVVGDKWLDVGLARTVGAAGMLVRTGYGGAEDAAAAGLEADAVVDNLERRRRLDPRQSEMKSAI